MLHFDECLDHVDLVRYILGPYGVIMLALYCKKGHFFNSTSVLSQPSETTSDHIFNSKAKQGKRPKSEKNNTQKHEKRS